jgi:hypothetical protein
VILGSGNSRDEYLPSNELPDTLVSSTCTQHEGLFASLTAGHLLGTFTLGTDFQRFFRAPDVAICTFVTFTLGAKVRYDRRIIVILFLHQHGEGVCGKSWQLNLNKIGARGQTREYLLLEVVAVMIDVRYVR